MVSEPELFKVLSQWRRMDTNKHECKRITPARRKYVNVTVFLFGESLLPCPGDLHGIPDFRYKSPQENRFRRRAVQIRLGAGGVSGKQLRT
jgi:hypothetical protein